MNFSLKISHALMLHFSIKKKLIMFSLSWWFILSPTFHATENWPEVAPS
jgi:hypothetical protein